MGPGRVGAGDEGVQPFDPVREAVGDEKVERAVSDRRLRAETRLAKGVENIIGPERAVLPEENLQSPAANRRQPQSLGGRAGLRLGKRFFHAGRVIVAVEANA